MRKFQAQYVFMGLLLVSIAGCLPAGRARQSTLTPAYQRLDTPIPAEIDKRITENLKTNGNCKFPCFWGVYPESTNRHQLETFFHGFGKEGFVYIEGDHTYESTTLSFQEYGRIYLKFDIQNNTVKNTEVTLDGLWTPEVENQDWSAYTLDEIFTNYGEPSSIELFVDTPNELIFYGILIRYEKIGTSLYYGGGKSGKIDSPKDQVTFCPGEEIMDLTIQIGDNPINNQLPGVPISEATTMDLLGFYELLLNDPNACFGVELSSMY